MGIRPAFIRKVKPGPGFCLPDGSILLNPPYVVLRYTKVDQEGMEYARCASPNAVIQTWKTSPIMFKDRS